MDTNRNKIDSEKFTEEKKGNKSLYQKHLDKQKDIKPNNFFIHLLYKILGKKKP